MSRSQAHSSTLSDIVEIVVPSSAFLDGPAWIGEADTATIETYSDEARKLVEAAVGPKVIKERFTSEAVRDLDQAYLKQFENAFDLFLMQNPALIPGNADTIDALRSHLLQASADKARAELELRAQLDDLIRSKEEMERELMERLREATRAKAERRVELTRQLERVQRNRIAMEESMQRDMLVAREDIRSYEIAERNRPPGHSLRDHQGPQTIFRTHYHRESPDMDLQAFSCPSSPRRLRSHEESRDNHRSMGSWKQFDHFDRRRANRGKSYAGAPDTNASAKECSRREYVIMESSSPRTVEGVFTSD